ncbi:stage III sporulation protein AF [Anaerovirgula multivorans]|uniref:Stage III sporulation protein AF n=1 Tax=Anaerovirgula multivorans TaxID=312168 RepID=A0A238ZVG9_9FIRM|nr:stage III sporulation protein AF [Anaerovirgula multivorans]SNR86774.1 stage III sporulation protein AF [Anaerovirgula multivorans]
MEMIREWIITIVSVIIFVTFVEILIPNSNNKRYINVVVGLLIMIVILNPLFYLFRGTINFEDNILQVSNQMEYQTMQNRIDHNQYLQNEAVIELYKTQLAQQMQNRVESLSDYRVEKIDLTVEEKDLENLGLIHQIDMTLKSSKTSKTEKKEIEPIKINVAINKNNNTVEADSIRIDNEEEIIKTDFSIYYSLPKDNINIYILKDK